MTTGCEVPKKPVFMRVCGLCHSRPIAFATFLQLFELKKAFLPDGIISSGLQVNKGFCIFKADIDLI